MASVEQAVAASAAVLQPASAPQPRKLRVGLYVDKRLQPRWAIEAFAKVVRSGVGEVVLIAAGDFARRAPLLCRLYGGIDRWAFGSGDGMQRFVATRDDLARRIDELVATLA